MDVLVYGINSWGDHSKGMARTAVESYGAKNMPVKGWNGAAYAIIIAIEKNKKMPSKKIKMQLNNLVLIAAVNRQLSFYFGEIESNGRSLTKDEIKHFLKWINRYDAYNIKLDKTYYEYIQ